MQHSVAFSDLYIHIAYTRTTANINFKVSFYKSEP
jgi:hypothetical protein